MKLPNVIIAGAPKSGSSSLFWWLAAHPDVCASKTKESHYFDDAIYPRMNASANFIEHGLEKYGMFFDHCPADAKVIMEATPIYMYQKTALEQLSALVPKPKVLFVLREPSQRAYSQYRFNRYRLGNEDAKVSYNQYMTFHKNKEGDPIARGRYINYLATWLDAFGRENMYVVQSEMLFGNKVSEMKKVAAFLGIDLGFYDRFDYMKRNETMKMRSTKLHRIGLKLQPLVPSWIQEKILIPFYLKINGTAMPPADDRDLEMVNSLKAEFTSDNEKLAKTFTNIDLQLWR